MLNLKIIVEIQVCTIGNLKKATLCRSVHVGASDEGH